MMAAGLEGQERRGVSCETATAGRLQYQPVGDFIRGQALCPAAFVESLPTTTEGLFPSAVVPAASETPVRRGGVLTGSPRL